MAAASDPWTVDAQLRQLIAAHQVHLDGQPPDRRRELDQAVRQLAMARGALATAETAINDVRRDLDEIGALAPSTRDGRAERRAFDERLQNRQAAAIDGAGPVAKAQARGRALHTRTGRPRPTEQQHGWRRGAIESARQRLDQHWTDVALACVRADQTLAYGGEPLRIGRRHLAGQLGQIEASLPPDRGDERDRARMALRTRCCDACRRTTARGQPRRARRPTPPALATARQDRHQRGERRSRRRPPTPRREPANRGRGPWTPHQPQPPSKKPRDAALAATASERHALNRDIGHLDTALARTRVGRVLQWAGRPTQLHVDVLGPVPVGGERRAVWCHQASRLEHHLDHADGNDATWHRLVHNLSVTPTLGHVADRRIAIQPHHQLRPTDWAPIIEHASVIHAATIEHARPSHRGLELELGL